jgi:hypothetical protein
MKKETVSVKYFDMENVGVSGFCDFCKKNIPLLFAVTITLFFTYGIKLFWYSIGIDTEAFMADKSGELSWSMKIGRFGYVLLSKFLHIKEFNPFTAFFTTFCLIWVFTISWCYIFAVFSKDTGKNNKLIPFALVFMTTPVWASQFYFLHQAAEIALIIALCPYIIYLLYKGFLDNEKGKIICGAVLLLFIISVYQSVILLFCCGTFACFLLFQEHSDYKPQVYQNLCLKLFLTLAASLAVYFFIDRVIISAVFKIERSGYLDEMKQWGQVSADKNIFIIFVFIYIIIGQIPFVQNIVDMIMSRFIGTDTIEHLAHTSRIYGNVLLLPAIVFFLISVTSIMRGTIPRGRRLLFLLAGIGIPLSIIFLTVVGGSMPPMRSQYALPLAAAFMLFFLIKTYKKKAAVVVACLTLLVAAYQAQITAQLLYSDQVRYNEDVRLAYELNGLINRAQPTNRKLPVAIIGRYQIPPRFHSNFLDGDMEFFGKSVFSRQVNQTVVASLAFMKSLGINFDKPNNSQYEQALKEAETMPAYPESGCVKRMRDFIVVKISETMNN